MSISSRSADGVEEVVCSYSAHAERPTFGELALWSSKPRAGTARCEEACNLLVLRSADFGAFFKLVPHFADMYSRYASTFDALSRMRAVHESCGRVCCMPTKRTLKALTLAMGKLLRSTRQDAEESQRRLDREANPGSFFLRGGRRRSSTEGEADGEPLVVLSTSEASWKRITEVLLTIASEQPAGIARNNHAAAALEDQFVVRDEFGVVVRAMV